MKLILLFCLALVTSFTHAECGLMHMSFYPKEKEISTNSMFIIEGFSMSQAKIENYRNSAVFLESQDNQYIQLMLQEICKGQLELTQAIFKPATPLAPNMSYYLVYKNPNYNGPNADKEPEYIKVDFNKAYWKTSSKPIKTNLKKSVSITYSYADYTEFGCGPSVNAVFKVTHKPNGEMWYKTELVDLNTNETTSYYLTDNEDFIEVGHGMCAGAFTYPSKGNYKVRFTPMTTEGYSFETTKWIIFKSPSQES